MTYLLACVDALVRSIIYTTKNRKTIFICSIVQ